MGRVEGKICCITGAANGLGRATTQTLSREGGVVVATDCRPNQARPSSPRSMIA
jgi:NAD(P)-dependent dehydrogenase (short-subunit alcohol dehydrogenase family)